MSPVALPRRCARGQVTNVRFRDLLHLVEALGFELVRVTGTHHIYAHPGIPELVNLQEVGGDAKPYQVRQVLRLVERYALSLEARP
jgi:predicted RNA binding protein YcfA (HicA-like mRNA interferase family)